MSKSLERIRAEKALQNGNYIFHDGYFLFVDKKNKRLGLKDPRGNKLWGYDLHSSKSINIDHLIFCNGMWLRGYDNEQ